MARREIEAGEHAWLTAFNSGDASGVAAMYSEGARLMPPNAEVLDGRGGIERGANGDRSRKLRTAALSASA